MIARRALECGRCGAPVNYMAAFCGYCRSPLTFGADLSIASGAPEHNLDFKAGDLAPGIERASGVMPRKGAGLEFFVAQGKTQPWSITPGMTDLTARVAGVCKDTQGGFGLRVRVHVVGSSSIGYRLRVRPATRQFRFERFVESSKELAAEALADWQSHAAVRGVDEPNEIEVRVADSVFQLFVNGARVGSVLDARLGYGSTGFEASSYGTHAHVVIESIRVGAAMTGP
jgi:hypothetical protein